MLKKNSNAEKIRTFYAVTSNNKWLCKWIIKAGSLHKHTKKQQIHHANKILNYA